MQYRTLVVAAALAFPALAGAGDAASGNAAETDVKVACIIDFVTSELDNSKHDSFIDECVQEKMAKLKATASTSKG